MSKVCGAALDARCEGSRASGSSCTMAALLRRGLIVLSCAVGLAGVSAAAWAQSSSTAYKYDALGRLTEATLGNGAKISYAYDAAGNRRTINIDNSTALGIDSAVYSRVNVLTGGAVQLTWTVRNASASSATCSDGLTINGSGVGTSTGGSVTVQAGSTAGTGSCTVVATKGSARVELSGTIEIVTPPVLQLVNCSQVSGVKTPNRASYSCTLKNVSSTAAGDISYSTTMSLGQVGSSSPTSCSGSNNNCGTVVLESGTAAQSYTGTFTATGSVGGAVTSNAVTLVVAALTKPRLEFGPCEINSPTEHPTSATLSCLMRNSGDLDAISIAYSFPAHAYVGAPTLTVSGPNHCSGGAADCGQRVLISLSSAGAFTGPLVARTNYGDEFRKDWALEVIGPPTIVSAAFSDSKVALNGLVDFNWTAANVSGSSATCEQPGLSIQGPNNLGTATAGRVSVKAGAEPGTGSCTVTAVRGGTTVHTTRSIAIDGSVGVVASLSASNVTVDGTTTLSWTSTNAISVSVACDAEGKVVLTGNGEGLQPNGSITLNARSTPGSGTCTVTARNAAGAANSASKTITVVALPRLDTTTIDKAALLPNGATTFRFTASNAVSTSGSCTGAVSGSSIKGAEGGGMPVTAGAAAGAGSCTASAVNAAGTTVTMTKNVSVIALTTSLSASNISAGGTTTLSWTTSNAATVTVSCDNGQVSVVGSGNGLALNGSIQLSAGSSAGSGVCTVKAADAAGADVSDSKTITVVAAPVLNTTSVDAATLMSGATTKLRFTASNAVSTSGSCTGAVSGSGTQPFGGGSVTVTAGAQSGDGTCTATATNALGTVVTRTVNMSVVGSPTVTASVAASTVTVDGTTTISWTSSNSSSATLLCTDKIKPKTTAVTGLPANGSYTVTAESSAGSGTCTVTTKNVFDQTASDSKTITVVARPILNTTGIDHGALLPNGATTFRFTASNAVSTSGNCTGAVSGSGVKVGSGGSIGVIAGATPGAGTCTATAVNAAGTTVTTTRNVSVIALTTSLSASTVTTGDTLTLSWTTGNAATVSVACDAGPMAIVGSGTGLALNGSISLKAVGNAGSGICTVSAKDAVGAGVTSSKTVTVVAAPVLNTTGIDHSTLAPGAVTTFRFTASNAVSTSGSCSGAVSGSGQRPAGGGSIYATAGTTPGAGTCTATAVNAAGKAVTSSRNVTVVAP